MNTQLCTDMGTALSRRIWWLIQQMVWPRGKSISEHRPNQTGLSRSDAQVFSLLSLPNDVLLCVADKLEPFERVVLSLSCKSLYRFMNSNKSNMAALDDVDVRGRFLKILERDLPDYLTCWNCSRMFLWRSEYGNILPTRCPRMYTDRQCTSWTKPSSLIQYGPQGHFFGVSRTCMDLLYRAQEFGASYGITVEDLNVEIKNRCLPHDRSDGVVRLNVPRFVAGQFMMLTTWHYHISRAHPLPIELPMSLYIGCDHWRFRSELRFTLEKLKNTSPESVGTVKTTIKCQVCLNDCKISSEVLDDSQWRITAGNWRSWGNNDEPYGFEFNEGERFTDEILEQRDLQMTFEAAEGQTMLQTLGRLIQRQPRPLTLPE